MRLCLKESAYTKAVRPYGICAPNGGIVSSEPKMNLKNPFLRILPGYSSSESEYLPSFRRGLMSQAGKRGREVTTPPSVLCPFQKHQQRL
jgi:hypothetical protein